MPKRHRCSNCGRPGHNKLTCTAPAWDAVLGGRGTTPITIPMDIQTLLHTVAQEYIDLSVEVERLREAREYLEDMPARYRDLIEVGNLDQRIEAATEARMKKWNEGADLLAEVFHSVIATKEPTQAG